MKKILTALLAGLVAAGSFATVSSAALAKTEELPEGAVAQFEDGTIVWIANAGFANEGAENLFDEDPQTKWCHQDAWSYVVWELPQAVSITGYQIVTASDNAEWPGRNPLDFVLSGCNDYDSETDTGSWEAIDTVTDSVSEGLQDLNWAEFTFNEFDVATAPEYKYYQFEINSVVGGGVMQMSGLNLLYEGKTAQSIDAEALAAEAAAAAAVAAREAALAKVADYEAYAADMANYTYPASGTTAPDGSVLINGERIGDVIGWGDTVNTATWSAFDGNIDSFFDPTTTGTSYCGIDAGEEMILTKVLIRPRVDWLTRFNGGVIEASNDPNFETKVDLYVAAEDAPELNYIDVTDQIIAANNTGYRYFRYINYTNTGNASEIELYGYAVDGSNPEYTAYVMDPAAIIADLTAEAEATETEAPETEAPETEAPETEAPETEAPETEAPETEAPETEAPETEAPADDTEEIVDVAEPSTDKEETEAPQTFDAAIIAGIAAVVSLAGYAVSKKH